MMWHRGGFAAQRQAEARLGAYGSSRSWTLSHSRDVSPGTGTEGRLRRQAESKMGR